MAKTLDELVRDVLGDQIMAILRLQTENAALKDQIAALPPKAEPAAGVASTSETPG